jgi:hypothetical protein
MLAICHVCAILVANTVETAAARKQINDTYKAQPSSRATGKNILQGMSCSFYDHVVSLDMFSVNDPPTIAVALSPTQAIKQTCSNYACLSDCASGPSTDNFSLPTPGQVQIDSLMDDGEFPAHSLMLGWTLMSLLML